MKAYDLEITGSLITSGSLTVKDDLDVQGLVTNKYIQGGASNTLDAPYYHFDGITPNDINIGSNHWSANGKHSLAMWVYP